MLLVIYALAMAVATFVENDYGTPVAKELLYNSWWFEVIMVLLVANFLANIGRYKLYRKEKWPLLVFHLAFFFIFAGGAITRYISFEGTMHIREGRSENGIISEATYLKIQIAADTVVQNYPDRKVTFLPKNIPGFFSLFRPAFNAKYDFQGEKITLKLIDFVPKAQDSIIADGNAPLVITLVTTEGGRRKKVCIPSGASAQIQGLEVGFDKDMPNGVSLTAPNGILHIKSALPARYMVMATNQVDTIKAINTPEPLHLRSLYEFGMGATFVIPGDPKKGRIIRYEGDRQKNAYDPDLIVLALQSHDVQDTVAFYGGQGITGYQATASLNNLKINLGYGSRYFYTPFYIHLKKFELEKYPGSSAPSSFASQVTVNDAAKQIPYRIYMNNILNYRGYRFFQSSYDSDEKGTILSVNHDHTGTVLTYTGYFMLFTGMFFTLFWKGTRFNILNQQLRALSAKKGAAVLVLLLSSITVSAHDNVPKAFNIDKQHAASFGNLPVQNFDGRIEPVNTLALEILRKLYRKESYHGLDANQFLLAVTTNPFEWVNAPLIKVNKRGGDALLKLTKANAEGITSIMNLLEIDTSGNAHFVLEQQYNSSFAKKASLQDNYDKEVIELNDKMQVARWLLSGIYLRILPVEGDRNGTWSALSLVQPPRTQSEQLVAAYYQSVQVARKTGSWGKADSLLKKISQLQRTEGANVLPSQTKLAWEVKFNSWNLFYRLMIFYSITGTLILVLSFFSLFSSLRIIKGAIAGLIVLLVMAAILQSLGIAIRWYISGHAPWSNGYEAVMFISLIGLVSGLVMYRNSNAFIPAAGALIAVILMGFAHGGAQMNPQITPLVPVLKSYWLMIHVAIITASYGFFGLSALLGMFVLLLHIANNAERRQYIDRSLRELTIVNELSMTVGLFLLTCGTFLGGMWANESWGRYWSWDPKETWAFISVIVYAFVLHARLIPGLGSKFLFNFLSLISFSTVIMTYFGVNYYLTGLHSYAKGDPMPIPSWIYITLFIVVTVSLTALFRYKKMSRKHL